MRKFNVTGQKFDGEAELIYNADGSIESVQLRNTSLSASQRSALLAGVPAKIDGLATAWQGKLTIIEADVEETFDMFFNEFGLKRNKQDALKLYNKLVITDRVLARLRIKPYKNCLVRMHQSGFQLRQMYPDTWLRGRHWEDEWETLK